MVDLKVALMIIFFELRNDLLNKNIYQTNTYEEGWKDSRLHILQILGFKKEDIDTPVKVYAAIAKYEEEIESWKE